MPLAPALALLAIVLSGAGCFWSKAPELRTDPVAFEETAQLVAKPAAEEPGRIELTFRDGDFQSPDLVVPPGDYEIVIFNEDNSVDTGFFLRLPDQYGREIHHVPGGTGGGIRKGTSKTFNVTLVPGQAYLYNCPITQSPDHMITAAAMPAP